MAAEGTAEAIAEATEKLEAGTIHVFDSSTFTVKGEALTSYLADVADSDNTGDTEVVMTVTSLSPSTAPLLTSI